MFYLYVENELQIFESKTQARRFYSIAARECDGAERDRYLHYLDVIAENPGYVAKSSNSSKTIIKLVLEYDKEENYLKRIL